MSQIKLSIDNKAKRPLESEWYKHEKSSKLQKMESEDPGKRSLVSTKMVWNVEDSDSEDDNNLRLVTDVNMEDVKRGMRMSQ